MLLSASVAYRMWAPSYDADPNPLLALEARVVRDLLPGLYSRIVVDVGCGTGAWLSVFQEKGINDVLGLDNIGVPAVAIMSNRITDEQVAKIERWAKRLAAGRVAILFDADEAGDQGAKEALWVVS